jgi:GNAT superfamily N-acetyltransferase
MSVVVRQAVTHEAVLVRRLQGVAARASFSVVDDLVSVARVARDTTAWFEPDSLSGFARWFATVVSDPEHAWWVAESAGRLVGFLHGRRAAPGVRVQGLYVDPDWWGQGVAGRLMEEFDSWTEGAAVGVVVLAHNGRAIRFYEKHSFVRDAPEYCVLPSVITMNRPGRQ